MAVNTNYSLVGIRQFDQRNTQVKEFFKEPSAGQKHYKHTVYINAQVTMIDERKRVYDELLNREITYGYLTIEYEELEDAGIKLKPGDIIVEIDSEHVNYRISEVIGKCKMETPSGMKPSLYQVSFVLSKVRIGGVE